MNTNDFLLHDILERPIHVNILRSARRSIEIMIYSESNIKVSAPKPLSHSAIVQYLQKKRKWLAQKMNNMQSVPQMIKSQYQYGEDIYYLGKRYLICAALNTKDNTTLNEEETCLMISPKAGSSLNNKIVRWLKEMATLIFLERLSICHQRFYQHFTCQIPTLRIRKMVSRFGSMSCRDHIMVLNQHLIHMPIACIDYVILHELCHLKYHNHSKRFYDMQSKILPEWPTLQRELRVLSCAINRMHHMNKAAQEI